jgi:hypothetical protein
MNTYPSTEQFKVVDTIAVPHPYCITAKHVALAADEFGGMLSDAAIEEAERRGIHCDICNRGTKRPVLTFAQHEKALLVEVNDRRELKDIPELKDYLLSIKDQATKEGYAGFAFKSKE